MADDGYPRAKCGAVRSERGLEGGRHDSRLLLSREDARGSAAEYSALSSWKDGMWTVVLVRPLNLANSDDKALKEGGVYHVGFAVHDDNITTRGHHVSFVRTLGIGAEADMRAVKLP